MLDDVLLSPLQLLGIRSASFARFSPQWRLEDVRSVVAPLLMPTDLRMHHTVLYFGYERLGTMFGAVSGSGAQRVNGNVKKDY